MAGKLIGSAFLRVRPDTGLFTREATPAMSSAGRSGGRTFGSAFRGALGGVAAAVGALLAGRAVLSFASDALSEARDAARVGRLTAAAIKSTGGAARVSASDVETLADKLGALAGVDDDVVQASQNLLLTFVKVRNATGKGNNIFDQASEAILNMTSAMNGGVITQDGLKTSTIQLGKALNNPLKGMTALTKVGVDFDPVQRQQIKRFVEAGNVMGAQKIILAELKKEFGGAAAAAADPAQKAAVAWANFKETMGGLFLPVLNRVSDVFAQRIVPLLEARLVPAIRNVAAVIQTQWVPVFEQKVLPALRTFAAFVRDEVLPRLRVFAEYVRVNILPVLQDLVERGVRGAVEAFVRLRATFQAHRAELTQLWNAFRTVVNFIVQHVLPVLGPIMSRSIKTGVLLIQTMIVQISFWVRAFNSVRSAVSSAVGFVKARISTLVADFKAIPTRIRQAVGAVAGLLRDAGADLVRGLWNGIAGMAGFLRDRVSGFIRDNVPGPVRRLLGISSPSKVFRQLGRDTIQGYIDGITSKAGAAQAAIGSAIPRPGFNVATGAGGGVVVQNLNLRAFSDRFSLNQVFDELAMHGVH